MMRSCAAYDWKSIANFITANGTRKFSGFEFAFELASHSGKAYMKRKEHFDTADVLRDYCLTHNVCAVHVGGVAVGDAFHGPLRFDVDVTDWSDCCDCRCADSKSVCDKCWRFANLAMYCLYQVLRYDFCYQDVWVFFSGRRGFHIYVQDDDAFDLGIDERHAVFEFLRYDAANPAVTAGMARCLPTITSYFRDAIQPLHARLKDVNCEDPHQLLSTCWPRVDKSPTTQPAHLLRCPFTCHGATGALVRLIDPSDLLTFSPVAKGS